MSKPCECPTVGFCDRHSVFKTPTWQRLCRENDKYRAAWDAGRGPGQPERPLEPKDRAETIRKIKAAVRQKESLKRAIRFVRRPGEGLGDATARLLDQAQRSQRHQIAAKLRRLLQCASCNQGRAVQSLNASADPKESQP